MAYIVKRQSHCRIGFYLVESYRNQEGRPRVRTLCYLGREEDGVDTLPKAIVHWQAVRERSVEGLRTSRGERAGVLRRREKAAALKLELLGRHVEAVSAKQRRRQQEEEDREHWQAFRRLDQHPSEENDRKARKAFLALAKRHHPDQGGDHHAFLRVKEAYERAQLRWKFVKAS